MTGKVNIEVINNVKRWVAGGAKDKLIADAFKFSVATVQNIKKSDYNYDKYRALVNKQLSKCLENMVEKLKHTVPKMLILLR